MNILKNLAFSEISMRAHPGANIGATIKESLAIAKTYQCRVNFEFNSVPLSLMPDADPDQVLSAYYMIMGDKKGA